MIVKEEKSMVKYKQQITEMLEIHDELFKSFKVIHDQYIKNPKKLHRIEKPVDNSA